MCGFPSFGGNGLMNCFAIRCAAKEFPSKKKEQKWDGLKNMSGQSQSQSRGEGMKFILLQRMFPHLEAKCD